jgi:acetoacetyl-CoA synthetase
MQAPLLGLALASFNTEGKSVIDEVGEMVLTRPIPSMPIFLWGDQDFKRYKESYFDEFPGVWRQGDFFRMNERLGGFVLGRSDATLNRHGIRIGTSEIYRTLALLPEIEDSLIVNLDIAGGNFFMPLFVKLRAGVQLDAALTDRIRAKLRSEYSPRHVPDKIYAVPDIPSTLTRKRMELPVRRILAGTALARAANRDAVANPAALDYFVEYARTQTDYPLADAVGKLA